MVLTINDVEELMKAKREIRKETYRVIYESASKKIKNSVKHGLKTTTVNIPLFIIGYPLYNVKKATKYIARQLEMSGFEVSINENDNNIKVSWNVRKIKKKQPQQEETEDVGDLPSLVNLKKLAKKYNN